MTEIKDNVTNENENINKKGVCAFCGRSVEKDHIYLYRAKHFSICAKCVEEFHMLNMAHNIKTDEHCDTIGRQSRTSLCGCKTVRRLPDPGSFL